jgi:hypothetical protein
MQLKRGSERTREGSARIAERLTGLSFERAQGAADAGHDPVLRAKLFNSPYGSA